MAQMYKVFYNRQTIIFTSNPDHCQNRSETVIVVEPKASGFISQLNMVLDPLINSEIIVAHPDCESYKRSFLSNYYPIYAAGGVVSDPMGRILVIKRRGLWDLPKGKQDPDETSEECAIRETTEETGIKQLSIVSAPIVTNHIYQGNKRWLIKHTSWFLMKTTFSGDPEPQVSEDITEAIWADKEFIRDEFMFNTYPSIKEVLRSFLPSLY